MLQGDPFTKYAENVKRIIEILESLGFYVKIDKLEIILKQQVTFSGFLVDSLHTTVALTIEKKQKKIEFVSSTKISSHSHH